MLLFPAAPLRQEQREPSLQRPGQRGHHHVRPVAHEIVHRHLQGPGAALELLDQILLVAALVGRPHDACPSLRTVVRDIEEVKHLIEQDQLAALDRQILAHHDDAVAAPTLPGSVVKLGHLFRL